LASWQAGRRRPGDKEPRRVKWDTPVWGRPSAIVVFAAALAGACGGSVEVTLPRPLLVVDSYPASGATVERAHLTRLTITFSEDLGEDAPTNGRVLEKVRLARRPGGVDLAIPGEPVSLGVPSYHRDSFTMDFEPPAEELDEKATPGAQLSLTVGAGLPAASGRTLPTDVRVLFWMAEEPDGEGG